jgi:ribose/xylose/arabinose/galactoside ABC-type transport system permease subunit
MERTNIVVFVQKAVKNYAMVFIFAGLFILFSIMNPSFYSWMNIRNLIVQNTYIVVTAVGISFVMMSGALDLSVGYQVAAIGVLTARLMTLEQAPVWFAVIVAILFGMFLGLINGGISVLFKIEPLIVTIATMTVFRGIANLISKGLSYNNFPDSFRVITRGSCLGIPVDVYIAIRAVAVASLIYNFTYYGRFVKAMGGNE